MRSRLKLYSELLAFALMGGLFGYFLAKGTWWAGFAAVGSFVGSCSFMARKYLPSDDAPRRII